MPVCAISTPTPHKISLSESVVNIFIWVSIFSPNCWWTMLLLCHRCSVLLIIYILWWFMICSSFHPSVKSCTQFNCNTWFIVNQSCMRSIVEKTSPNKSYCNNSILFLRGILHHRLFLSATMHCYIKTKLLNCFIYDVTTKYNPHLYFSYTLYSKIIATITAARASDVIGACAPFQYPIRRLTLRSRKDSNRWHLVFKCNAVETPAKFRRGWKNLNTDYAFETVSDLTISV